MKWYAVSLIIAVSASAIARPERNAFLNYSAHSVHELVIEVDKDPAVADRYERHFGMCKEQVVSFFQGLHLCHLENSAVFDVYSIPPDGHVKMHHQKLEAGVLIYADNNGTPILLERCGNPIIAPKEGEVLVGGPSGPAAPLHPGEIAGAVGAETDLALTAPITPEDTYVPAPVVTVPPAEGVVVTATTAGGSHQDLSWLYFVAAGGAVYGLSTIHSGGGNHYHHTQPVPEPSTYALLGLGLGGVFLRRKKKAQA